MGNMEHIQKTIATIFVNSIQYHTYGTPFVITHQLKIYDWCDYEIVYAENKWGRAIPARNSLNPRTGQTPGRRQNVT